jgi:hypothetical protein
MSVADVNTPRRTSNRVTKGLERTAEIRISSGQLAGIPENYLGQIVFRSLPSIDSILFVESNGWNVCPDNLRSLFLRKLNSFQP